MKRICLCVYIPKIAATITTTALTATLYCYSAVTAIAEDLEVRTNMIHMPPLNNNEVVSGFANTFLRFSYMSSSCSVEFHSGKSPFETAQKMYNLILRSSALLKTHRTQR